MPVPGGWHTLGGMLDVDNVIGEQREDNNSTEGQWLWKPKVVARNVPSLRAAPPVRGARPTPNCDAVAVSRDVRYAWIVSAGGFGAGDDYDLGLFDDYANSTTGLSHSLAQSSRVGDGTEFVLGTFQGPPTTLYPATTRTSAAQALPYRLDYTDARGRTSDIGVGVWANQFLPPSRVADVYEMYFESGVPSYIVLSRRSGTADLGFEVFGGGATGIYSRGQSGVAGASHSVDAGTDTLRFVPSTTGWHPIAVFRTGGADVDSLRYTLIVQDHPTLDAPGTPVPSRAYFSRPSPNPVSGSTVFALGVPARSHAEVEIFDLSGRRVASLVKGTLEAGEHRIAWNALAANGQRAKPGVYMVRARVGEWSDNTRVVVE